MTEPHNAWGGGTLFSYREPDWQALKAVMESMDELSSGRPEKRRTRQPRSARLSVKPPATEPVDSEAVAAAPAGAPGGAAAGASEDVAPGVAAKLAALQSDADRLKARHG